MNVRGRKGGLFRIGLGKVVTLLSRRVCDGPGAFIHRLLRGYISTVATLHGVSRGCTKHVSIFLGSSGAIVFHSGKVKLGRRRMCHFLAIVKRDSGQSAPSTSSFVKEFNVNLLSYFMIASRVGIRDQSTVNKRTIY